MHTFKAFQDRLLYVGLQGSYLRDEATEHSDIDVMVVIDQMTVADLNVYRNAIASLPEVNKSCGFICGAEELRHWNSLEICHLLNTTKDYYGILLLKTAIALASGEPFDFDGAFALLYSWCQEALVRPSSTAGASL